MANITTGTFTHFNLSQEEILSGSILTLTQSQLLQTELAQIAELRLEVVFDPANPLKFAQEEAFLKGQMSVIRNLIDRSKEAEQLLLHPSK